MPLPVCGVQRRQAQRQVIALRGNRTHESSNSATLYGLSLHVPITYKSIMNKVEVESERIRQDMAEILGLSSADETSSSDDCSSVQSSPNSSWKDSRTLYEPTTSQLRDLANQSRYPIHLSSPPTLQLSLTEAARSLKKTRDKTSDLSSQELPITNTPRRSPTRKTRQLSSPNSPSSPTKSQVASPSPHNSRKDKRRSDAIVASASPRPRRSNHPNHMSPPAPRRLPRTPRRNHTRDTDDDQISPKYHKHHEHKHSSRPPMSPSEGKRSSKKNTKRKMKHYSSNQIYSTCNSSNESRSDGWMSSTQLLTESMEAARESPKSHVSPRPDKHKRRSSKRDDTTTDTDVTPRIKPAMTSSSNSHSRTHWRSRYSTQDSSSTLSSLDQSRRGSRRNRVGGNSTRKKDSENHPPTDLEFALGMDSATRKLKRIVKDQEESASRKKVDYDQLRNMLDDYARNPNKADQGRLNELLEAMGEAIIEADGVSRTTTKTDSPSSYLNRSSRSQEVSDDPSVGNNSQRSTSARSTPTRQIRIIHEFASEHSRESPTRTRRKQRMPGSEAEVHGGMDVHKKEILQACGDNEVNFVSVPRRSAMRRGHLSSSSLQRSAPTSPQSRSSKSLGNLHDSSISSSARPGRHNRSVRFLVDDSTRRSHSARSVVSTPPTISFQDEEIYKAIDLAEGSTILSEVRAAPKNAIERHKKEVLEVFGNDVHGVEDFVAVPLKPAVPRARSDGEVEEEEEEDTDEPISHSPSRSEPIGDHQEQKSQDCCGSPRRFPRGAMKRICSWRSKRRNYDSQLGEM